MPAPQIKAYAFDAYGTLFDVAAAVNHHSADIGPDAAAMAALWRVKQLEYTWVMTLMGRYENFWELTQKSLDFVLARYPDVPVSMRQSLLDAYWKLGAYADAKPALEALLGAGKRMVVFSNGTPDMVEAAIRNAGLETLIERVISIDAIRRFKTVPETYQLVGDYFNLPLGEVALVSSNRWDVAGAINAGMQAIWCNRTAMPDEYLAFRPQRMISALGEL